MSYKIRQIGSRAVNLLTLESIVRQNLIQKAVSTSSATVVTTVLAQTGSQHQQELTQLSKNPNIRIVPFDAPLLYAHHASSLHFETTDNPARLSLLFGQPSSHFLNNADPKRIVTLQELSQALPEKVPLSLRSRDSAAARKRLQDRLGMHVGEKGIEFQNVLVVGESIPMWDEAIQVALDCQPTPVIIPYLKENTPKDQLYRLTLPDFIRGLKTIHMKVSSAVKTHPPLNLHHFDQKRQLNWILTNVVAQAQAMTIDRFFFTHPPAIKDCNGSVKVIDSLEGLL